MRKTILLKLSVFSSFLLLMLGSCKDDSNLKNSAPIPDQSFVQEFDTVKAAQDQGWKLVNRSSPIGRSGWTQGNSIFAQARYNAYSSKATSEGFISSDYSVAGPAPGTLDATESNFLISPSVILQNGDKIIFFTREDDSISRWADRLQVCINQTNDDYTACGRGRDAGLFNTVLLDINPNYASGFTIGTVPTSVFDAVIPYFPNNSVAYPRQWTRFEAKILGLPAPVRGRFAFRHFVEFGGEATGTVGSRGSVVSVDSVAFVSISRH